MPPPAKKWKFLSLQDKAAIIAQVEKGRKKDIEFGIACSLLSTILKCKATVLGALGSGARVQNKTVTAAAFPGVDKAVFAWFREQRANKVPLSGKILQQKALDFAGWLSRFKARQDIVAKAISGEAAGVDLVATSPWLSTCKEILDQYEPSDVYNADEIGLFLPNASIEDPGLERPQMSGRQAQ